MIGSRLVVLLCKRLSDLFLLGTGVSDEPPDRPGIEFSAKANRLHFTIGENCTAHSTTEVAATYISGLRDLTLNELELLTLDELGALTVYGYYDEVKVPGFGVTAKGNRFHFTARG